MSDRPLVPFGFRTHTNDGIVVLIYNYISYWYQKISLWMASDLFFILGTTYISLKYTAQVLTRASLVNPHLLRLERHVTKLLIPKYCSRPLLSLTISLKVPACLIKYQTDHPICLLHLTTIRYGMVYGILQKTDVDFGIVIQLFPQKSITS